MATPTQPTLSLVNFNLGDTITISLTPAVSIYTHTLTYSFGDATGSIATGVSTSTTWAVPKSLANQIPNANSGYGSVICQTFDGSTLIGKTFANFTANVPTTLEFQPSITNISITDANSDVANTFHKFVQGNSQLAINFTANGAYGSTIASLQVIANGQTSNTIPFTTNLLTTSGDQDVEMRIVDSRGRSFFQQNNVNVVAYAPPAVTDFTAQRTNSDGTPNPAGSFVTAIISAAISPISNLNTHTFTLQYQVQGASSWMSVNVPSGGFSLTNQAVTVSGINVNSMYNFRLLAIDHFSTTTSRTAVIQTSFTLMDFLADGTGMAFGKAATKPGVLEVGSAMPLVLDAPSANTAGSQYLALQRGDGTLAARITTGDSGSGLEIHMFNAAGTAETGVVRVPLSGVDYSYSELPTGQLWVDGKMIYSRTVNFGALPNNTTTSVAHGISSFDKIVDVKAVAEDSSNLSLPLPYVSFTTGGSILIYVNSTSIAIQTGMDRSSFTAQVTLYYTK